MLYRENKKTGISLTCFRRADYLETVLNSLRSSIEYCNTNIDTTTLYVSIDYYDDTIPNIIKNIDWINVKYIINRPSIGCNANTRQAMLMSLEENDATIHLEDDTVLSKDAIDFYLMMFNIYHDDDKIISISGYNRTPIAEESKMSSIIIQKHFTCWACAFWKHKFNIFLQNWTPYCDRNNRSSSWDSYLENNIFRKDTMDFYQVKPEISRIQNIGALLGTWVPGADWHKINHRSPATSDDIL